MNPVLAAVAQHNHVFHTTPREGEWIAAILVLLLVGALVKVLSS